MADQFAEIIPKILNNSDNQSFLGLGVSFSLVLIAYTSIVFFLNIHSKYGSRWQTSTFAFIIFGLLIITGLPIATTILFFRKNDLIKENKKIDTQIKIYQQSLIETKKNVEDEANNVQSCVNPDVNFQDQACINSTNPDCPSTSLIDRCNLATANSTTISRNACEVLDDCDLNNCSGNTCTYTQPLETLRLKVEAGLCGTAQAPECDINASDTICEVDSTGANICTYSSSKYCDNLCSADSSAKLAQWAENIDKLTKISIPKLLEEKEKNNLLINVIDKLMIATNGFALAVALINVVLFMKIAGLKKTYSTNYFDAGFNIMLLLFSSITMGASSYSIYELTK